MNIRKLRKKPQINIVPLIDVLIVLLFFFLMTMQFRHLNVLDITPPRMESAGQEEMPAQIMLSVNREGEYFIDNDPVSEEALPGRLRELAAGESPPVVLIQADEDAPVKYLAFALDQTRLSGLERVRLQTR